MGTIQTTRADSDRHLAISREWGSQNSCTRNQSRLSSHRLGIWLRK